MLVTYKRRVEEGVSVDYVDEMPNIGEWIDTRVVMQVLGYLQLVLAFIAAFFWMMIEYPLVCKAKWKELKDDLWRELRDQGEDLTKYRKTFPFDLTSSPIFQQRSRTQSTSTNSPRR